MFVDYTEEQKALRQELRACFDDLMTSEVRAGLVGLEGGPAYRGGVNEIQREIVAMLGLGMPRAPR
jgi:hypothetical protein